MDLLLDINSDLYPVEVSDHHASVTIVSSALLTHYCTSLLDNLQVADKFSLALSTTLHRNNEDFPDYYDKVSHCFLLRSACQLMAQHAASMLDALAKVWQLELPGICRSLPQNKAGVAYWMTMTTSCMARSSSLKTTIILDSSRLKFTCRMVVCWCKSLDRQKSWKAWKLTQMFFCWWGKSECSEGWKGHTCCLSVHSCSIVQPQLSA